MCSRAVGYKAKFLLLFIEQAAWFEKYMPLVATLRVRAQVLLPIDDPAQTAYGLTSRKTKQHP